MRSTILWYMVTMVLVGAIAGVGMLWCHFSHLRRHQGPELMRLWASHGIHVMDVVVLSVELALLLALSVTLFWRDLRRR